MLSVIGLGLASRSQILPLPLFVREYAGDALYAVAAYLTLAFLAPRLSVEKTALLAGVFCFAVEISQLYHAPWIDAIRHWKPGGLVLGFGFLWSDLICYVAGVTLAALAEMTLVKTKEALDK